MSAQPGGFRPIIAEHWNDVMRREAAWQTAYDEVARAVRPWLTKRGRETSYSTVEVVDALYPVELAQRYGVPALYARKRIFKGLLAMAPEGRPLAAFARRGHDRRLPNVGRIVKPWLWAAPIYWRVHDMTSTIDNLEDVL